MKVYLIRHTKIDVEPGVCYGQSDIDVADSFPEDSKEVKSKLPNSAEESIFFSSPLKRCRKLAETLTSQKVHFDRRLQELNFGDWELKKWADIPEDQIEEWSGDISVSTPGGESYLELNNRVREWWKELVKADYESVVVVSHAGVIRSIFSQVLDITFEKCTRLVLDWGHISAVSVNNNNYKIEFINR